MITPDELEAMRDRFYVERNDRLLGVHNDMSNAEYHAENGLSNSGCSLMDKSMHHLMKRPKIQGDHLDFGSAVHAALLEPEVFDECFIRGPEVSKNSNTWKNAQKRAEEAGATLMSPDVYDKVAYACEGAMRNPIAAELLSDASGVAERSIFARSNYHDILLKIRPDLWIKDADIIVDLKTTKCAAPRGNDTFARKCGQYRYDKQAAMYSDVIKSVTGNEQDFYFVAIESEEPYETVVYKMSSEDITTGRADYMANVYDLAQFLRDPTGKPFGYSDGIETISIPKYFRRK